MTDAPHDVDAAPAGGLAALAREIRNAARAETVFGTPVRAGATTLIPVAKAAIGIGGGRHADAAGAGAAARVRPVGYIVLDAAGARYTSLLGPQLQAALVGLAVGLWLGRRRRR